jgi:hypothetical protein
MINNRGQSLGLSIMAFILVIIVGFSLINFLMPEITDARTNLSCSDGENIADGNKLLCLVFDITIPYWIWIIMAIAIGAITARFTL